MRLTTDLHLMLRVRNYGTILPLWPYGFAVCTGYLHTLLLHRPLINRCGMSINSYILHFSELHTNTSKLITQSFHPAHHTAMLHSLQQVLQYPNSFHFLHNTNSQSFFTHLMSERYSGSAFSQQQTGFYWRYIWRNAICIMCNTRRLCSENIKILQKSPELQVKSCNTTWKL